MEISSNFMAFSKNTSLLFLGPKVFTWGQKLDSIRIKKDNEYSWKQVNYVNYLTKRHDLLKPLDFVQKIGRQGFVKVNKVYRHNSIS